MECTSHLFTKRVHIRVNPRFSIVVRVHIAGESDGVSGD